MDWEFEKSVNGNFYFRVLARRDNAV